ncbi:MAG: hypothetical protein C0483_20245 [Pirellula sp.]|nr:hypothetical protein [Pirellula sp.]
MAARTLITGVGGFTGRWLAEALRADGVDVFGLGRSPTTAAAVAGYYACDVADASAVREVIEDVRPSRVYHLASCAPTASSEVLHATVVDGFRNLYSALAQTAARTGDSVRMVTIGSAAELGTAGTAQLPAREDSPCEPATPYGKAKLAVTRIVRDLPIGGPVQVVTARTFNLVGPGLPEHLALGRFARQVQAVRAGESQRILCGTLGHRRDFVDVRDAVEGYRAVMQNGRPGETYNICRGRSHRIGDLLDMMLRLADVAPMIEESSGAPRCDDIEDVFGDVSKTHAECAWRASLPIERSLQDLLSVFPAMSA